MLIKHNRISALGERVLSLERALSEYDHDPSFIFIVQLSDFLVRNIEDLSSHNGSNQRDREPSSKKRKRDHFSRLESASNSARDDCSIGSTTHHAEQARVVIQGELDGNERMDLERKSILRSALQFVDVMAQGKTSNPDKSAPLDMPCEYPEDPPSSITPSAELLYMLLPEPTAAVGRSTRLQWPDHISDKTLEKMALTILNDSDNDNKHDHGQVFYQYCICIYVKAIFHIFQKPRAYKDPQINAHFLKSKKSYESCAFRALKRLDFLNPPTLPFIQSLISAASLTQYLGNMSQAWILNSYAARLITALEYHEIRKPQVNSHHDDEIHRAVSWCFYLDRSLSTLLYRPLSLPEPRISPANLISDYECIPYIPLIRILFDLAQIQGELLACGNADNTPQIIANHSNLQERMEAIHSRLQTNRTSAPDMISFDWHAADFCYYAILVDILRSRLKYSFSPLTHKECLSCSRKSLKALHHLQRNLTDSPGFVDPYPSFLTWTVLLYPLSPFFVLFCNIIGELDMDDYNLMRDITQNLSQFAASPYISKLHKLLDALQNLCAPLIEAKQRIGSEVKVANLYPSMAGTQQDYPVAADEHGHLLTDDSCYMDPTVQAYPQQLQTPSDGSYPPDEQLMWQLFNSQLSLDWFESNHFPY
ncbi:transcriptional regulator family: Fungal Specific TF [Penicillium sp. IBT 31633x]|nr:transcriptional regulator family: Fungal Specific TF [Penicillium sp. IBT 31633x]